MYPERGLGVGDALLYVGIAVSERLVRLALYA